MDGPCVLPAAWSWPLGHLGLHSLLSLASWWVSRLPAAYAALRRTVALALAWGPAALRDPPAVPTGGLHNDVGEVGVLPEDQPDSPRPPLRSRAPPETEKAAACAVGEALLGADHVGPGAVVELRGLEASSPPRRSRVSPETERAAACVSGEATAIEPPGLDHLGPGAVVELRGLKAAPALNGREGVVECYVEASSRWRVRLCSGDRKDLRAENLRPRTASPASGAAPTAASSPRDAPAGPARLAVALPVPATPRRRQGPAELGAAADGASLTGGPCAPEGLPLTRQLSPLARQTSPLARQLSPLARQTSPLARQASPREDPPFADLNLVESVRGLQGLKLALAARFAGGGDLPDSFRCGYVVDLDRHWISVHATFSRSDSASSLSLIVFDTLEVNYQHWYRVGLLRTFGPPGSPEFGWPGRARGSQAREDDGVDVATLCQLRGIQYDISFLTPIFDMRRLTWEEEEEIRAEKSAASVGRSTVYYDQEGKPFRKIIVQPILQAERDGTCKSRALAALGWLLRLDEDALEWYVESTREMFLVELRARQKVRRGMLTCGDEPLEVDPGSEGEEDEEIFGSLMSTGRRDKFGRTLYMKVCHANTARYNQLVDEGCSATTRGRCLPGQQGARAILPTDSPEASLRRRREEEVRRIRQVVAREQRDGSAAPAQGPPRAAPADAQGAGRGGGSGPLLGPEQRWRAIEDHEARWHFLESTCFFGHNIGFRKIRKLYAKDEVLAGQSRGGESASALADSPGAPRDDSLGFGDTKYLRKYTVSGNYVTHEADPIFHEPVENFLGFLSGDRDETVTLPFYALPFPSCFQAVALKDYVRGRALALDLEGDFDEHVGKQVSDFSIPSGNIFLNDPTSYNRASAAVSAPVRLRAP